MDNNKTIIIAGGTGFIGQFLSNELIDHGHRVFILSRKTNYQSLNKNLIYLSWDSDLSAIDKIDVVINLAGDNIGKGCWTKTKKNSILESRIQSIIKLAELIKRKNLKPEIWIQSSAIGFYGYKTSGLIFEGCPQGEGFLSQVVNELEKTFTLHCPAEVKPVVIRLGVVLHRSGGLLKQMLQTAPFKWIGCPGNGRQKLSWIALEDLSKIIIQIINHQITNALINTVSPNPNSMEQFCKVLKEKTKAWFVIKIPEFILKLAFGAQKTNELILADQTVDSKILQEIGFKFDFPNIENLKF